MKKISIPVVLAGAMLLGSLASGPATAGGFHHPRCDTQDIVPLLQEISGKGRLCIGRHGIVGSLRAKNLVPGDAYTVWWVYFDDPSQCIGGGPGICGDADFGGEKPLAVFGRMDSVVVSRRGRAWFSDFLRSMKPSSGSQVWLLVFGHGPANTESGAALARQLLTPEDPLAGAPHLGNFVDGGLGFPAAVAVFAVD